jgi:hypothetical protein
LRSETEDLHLVFVGFVQFCELAAEFVLGDIGAIWVEDITMISQTDQLIIRSDHQVMAGAAMEVTYTTICRLLSS